MAISCGFYNSKDGDKKYDARDFSHLFDGIIRDGVFMSIGTNFMATADGTDMSVLIGIGHAWFNHSWTANDAPFVLPIDQSEVILNRIDTVVLEVNSSLEIRDNTVKVIKGTPSSEAVRPELVNTEEVHQYPICDIFIGAEVETIFQENITNRVGTSDTPFVTGILETINIDRLIAQWENEWENYVIKKLNDTTAWTENQKKILAEYQDELQREMGAWQNSTKLTFEEWFSHLQVQLEGDVAANLQLQLDSLNKITFERFNSIMNITTDINRDDKGNLLNIVEVSDEAETTTTFGVDQNGDKEIVSIIVPTNGHWTYTKTVLIKDVLNGKKIIETYNRAAKQ